MVNTSGPAMLITDADPPGGNGHDGDPRGADRLAGTPGGVRGLLELARAHLGMEVAWVSQFTGGEQVIRALAGDGAALNLAVGSAGPLEGSFCAGVLAGTLPALIPHTRRHPVARSLAGTTELGIGSYVGAALHGSDGQVVGMLCCLSRAPSPHLDEAAARFLALVADQLTALLSAGGAAGDGQRVRVVLDTGGIDSLFQPLVDLDAGRAVAFEALARFDPLVFPGPTQAFAAAWRAGLGTDLELLAIQQAFAHLDTMPAGLWMGVNLSAEALLDPAVQNTLLAPAHRRIAVEITEHTQVHDYEPLLGVTVRLQAAGIHIVIDDAGSGYASLRHVLRLHPDAIKLDLDIVRGVDTDPGARALTRAMVTFAAEIGARLIGEGIQTPAELATLQRLGVRLGQGYLLGRPAALPPTCAHHPPNCACARDCSTH